MKKNITIVLVSLLSTICFSQKSDIGNWFVYLGNQKINSKLNWHNEVQYRNYNFIGDTSQLLLRTGLGLNLTENNNNVLLGYGFINSQNYSPNTSTKTNNIENRIYQQFLTKQNFGRFYLQHRYRIEERFLKDDFQMRFRYFVGASLPLNKKNISKNALYISTYNEIFINVNNSLFDRNRLYGAIGYSISDSIKIEVGLLAQTLEKANRNQFQIVLFNNLPL